MVIIAGSTPYRLLKTPHRLRIFPLTPFIPSSTAEACYSDTCKPHIICFRCLCAGPLEMVHMKISSREVQHEVCDYASPRQRRSVRQRFPQAAQYQASPPSGHPLRAVAESRRTPSGRTLYARSIGPDVRRRPDLSAGRMNKPGRRVRCGVGRAEASESRSVPLHAKQTPAGGVASDGPTPVSIVAASDS